MIEAKILRRLSYDPETGVFTWKDGRNAGMQAGSVNKRGYQRIKICGREVKAHRAAFLLMTGAWPRGVVDHINWETSDNRWSNLRDVSVIVNAQNRNPSANRHGAHFHAKKRKWESRATVGWVRKYLGSFSTFEEAVLARISAENGN